MNATPIVVIMFLIVLAAIVYDYVRLGSSPWAK